MTFENHLLARLPAGDRDRLASRLESVNLRKGEVILELGSRIPYVYFPANGFASLEYGASEGTSLGVATIGREGMIGVHVLFRDAPVPYFAIAQAPSTAYRLRTSVLTTEISRHPALHHALLDYAAGLFNQIGQAAHCHYTHSVLQRVCRWLLTADDHVGTSLVEVTQEDLSRVLGSTRNVVTRALAELSEADSIWIRRGRILLRCRPRLEATTCDCYEPLKSAPNARQALMARVTPARDQL